MGRNEALPDGAGQFRVDAGNTPDDTGCGVLHVDMDAFFAAVELRTRPDLVDRPVLVAGTGPRSVVLSANYLARRYGVHSAMPIGMAHKLCPDVVRLPPSRDLYREVSRGVMAIFEELTPLVEPLSVDEAFLDVSGALRRLQATPAAIGARIREQVVAKHGITCSVGAAGVKFVAKLASGRAKPDGMIVVPVARTLDFLHPLPVSALPGVGPKTEQNLRRHGLDTIADVAYMPLSRLRRLLGSAMGEQLHALAQGRDERDVLPKPPEKSIGAEHTFDTDQDDRDVLSRELLRLAEQVATVLRAKGVRGRTVSIKVRFADFRTITRSQTRFAATDVTRQIHDTAITLLAEVPRAAVRLIGVRLDGLVDGTTGEQLAFTAPEPCWREAEIAADTVRSKFGAAAVRPASLLSPEQK